MSFFRQPVVVLRMLAHCMHGWPSRSGALMNANIWRLCNCREGFLEDNFRDLSLSSWPDVFIYLFLFSWQGHCTLIKHSCKCTRISQRLFFICSPWTRCYKSTL